MALFANTGNCLNVTKNQLMTKIYNFSVTENQWKFQEAALFPNVHLCGPGGSMRASHAAGPGSIPGRDKFPG